MFSQILLETQRWIVATRTSTEDCSVRRLTGKIVSKIISWTNSILIKKWSSKVGKQTRIRSGSFNIFESKLNECYMYQHCAQHDQSKKSVPGIKHEPCKTHKVKRQLSWETIETYVRFVRLFYWIFPSIVLLIKFPLIVSQFCV